MTLHRSWPKHWHRSWPKEGLAVAGAEQEDEPIQLRRLTWVSGHPEPDLDERETSIPGTGVCVTTVPLGAPAGTSSTSMRDTPVADLITVSAFDAFMPVTIGIGELS